MKNEKNQTQVINELQKQIEILKLRLIKLEKQRAQSPLNRHHLVRVKNDEELSDEYILKAMGYHDLSPEKAYRLYEQSDIDFILLDVSDKDYVPFREFPESRKIPLEELSSRTHELKNKNQNIFVISEKGVRSILACHILNAHGFYYLSNISGGHKFWPANQLSYDHDDFDEFLKEA